MLYVKHDTCNGTGEIKLKDEVYIWTCIKCNGTGIVPKEDLKNRN